MLHYYTVYKLHYYVYSRVQHDECRLILFYVLFDLLICVCHLCSSVHCEVSSTTMQSYSVAVPFVFHQKITTSQLRTIKRSWMKIHDRFIVELDSL